MSITLLLLARSAPDKCNARVTPGCGCWWRPRPTARGNFEALRGRGRLAVHAAAKHVQPSHEGSGPTALAWQLHRRQGFPMPRCGVVALRRGQAAFAIVATDNVNAAPERRCTASVAWRGHWWQRLPTPLGGDETLHGCQGLPAACPTARVQSSHAHGGRTSAAARRQRLQALPGDILRVETLVASQALTWVSPVMAAQDVKKTTCGGCSARVAGSGHGRKPLPAGAPGVETLAGADGTALPPAAEDVQKAPG
mmetsp:Transcript_20634/g.62640  ORF Transcript_20634/g.62640 Transcript_20634/m.62640 type:complete len:253 (-) Transcript_20634:2-760(-)